MNAKLYPARALHPDSCLHAWANGYSGTTDTAMNIESASAKSPCVHRDTQKADTMHGQFAAWTVNVANWASHSLSVFYTLNQEYVLGNALSSTELPTSLVGQKRFWDVDRISERVIGDS
jgi:hypothetical protein